MTGREPEGRMAGPVKLSSAHKAQLSSTPLVPELCVGLCGHKVCSRFEKPYCRATFLTWGKRQRVAAWSLLDAAGGGTVAAPHSSGLGWKFGCSF